MALELLSIEPQVSSRPNKLLAGQSYEQLHSITNSTRVLRAAFWSKFGQIIKSFITALTCQS